VWSGVVLRHLKKISFEWLMQPFATTAYVKSLGSRNAVQTAATHCCLFHSVWTIRTWPDQKQPNISSAADDLSIADRFVSLIFAGLFLAQRPTTVQEQKEWERTSAFQVESRIVVNKRELFDVQGIGQLRSERLKFTQFKSVNAHRMNRS